MASQKPNAPDVIP